MAGQFIKKVHLCEPPNRNGLGNGTQWQCECGQVFELFGVLGWTSPAKAERWRSGDFYRNVRR